MLSLITRSDKLRTALETYRIALAGAKAAHRENDGATVNAANRELVRAEKAALDAIAVAYAPDGPVMQLHGFHPMRLVTIGKAATCSLTDVAAAVLDESEVTDGDR